MVVTQLFSKKVKNSLRNGPLFNENSSDFTTFVKGNVLNKLEIELNIDVGWFVDLDGLDVSFVRNSTDSYKGFIYSASVNWLSEGFSVGDEISYSVDVLPSSESAFIQSIDGNYLYISSNVQLNLIPDESEWGQLKGVNTLENVEFGYGFVESSFSLNNEFTNTTQRYFANNINTIKNGEAFDKNNNAWQTGGITAEFIGKVQDRDIKNPENTFSRYRIIQRVTPSFFYKDGELNNLINKIAPARFAGEKTLKHVFETQFKDSVYNPNQSKSLRLENDLSSLGWLGEASNGFESNFSVKDVVYTVNSEVKNTIQADETTRLNFTLVSNNNIFSSATYIEVGHVRVLREDQYSNSVKTWNELWMFDVLRQVNSVPALSSDIIKFLIATPVSSSEMAIQCDIQYSAEQKAEIENGDNFMMFINVEDSSLSADSSDLVCEPIDVNEYEINTDVKDLIDLDNISFYRNFMPFDSENETGFTDLKAWNESAFMCDFRLKLNTEKSPVFSSLKAVLVAYNSTTKDMFDIESYGFNLDSVTVDNVEQIEIDSTRGYNLSEGSQFNLAKLKNDGEDSEAQYYRGQIGFKIDWKSWVELPGANNVFYNANEDFKGKNKKTSNYSLKEGYAIKFVIRTVLFAQNVDTTYNLSSPDFEILDYEQEPAGNSNWTSQEVQTFINDETSNVEGSVLSSENTFIKCIASPSTVIDDVSKYWGVIRVEEQKQSGFNIDELDSENSYPSSNRLIPLASESNTKLSLESGNLILTCLFDASKINTNSNYSISFEVDTKESEEESAYSDAYSDAYS